jgi:hypothetical protein
MAKQQGYSPKLQDVFQVFDAVLSILQESWFDRKLWIAVAGGTP